MCYYPIGQTAVHYCHVQFTAAAVRDGAVHLFVCLFDCLFVCLLKHVLLLAAELLDHTHHGVPNVYSPVKNSPLCNLCQRRGLTRGAHTHAIRAIIGDKTSRRPVAALASGHHIVITSIIKFYRSTIRRYLTKPPPPHGRNPVGFGQLNQMSVHS